MIENVRNRLKSVKNYLAQHDLKILSSLYLGSLSADAAITANEWSKGRGGEGDPTALDMMIKYGPHAGIAVVSFLDALLTFLNAATGYYVAKAIPELEKYPRVKKVWPYMVLLYRTSEHINGFMSWMR